MRGLSFAAATIFAAAFGVSAGQAGFRPAPRLATTKPAANEKTFTDPKGDNTEPAPDITTVSVLNDDVGRFEVRVTLANKSDLLDQDFVSVYFNTDEDIRTGCDPNDLGADYAVTALGHTAPTADFFSVARCINSHPDRFTPQRTFTGEYDAGNQTVVFRFGCAEIGRPRSLRLVVVGSHGDPNEPSSVVYDFGGVTEAWLYDVIPACGPDTTRPRVRALPSVGIRGGDAKLSYHVEDDSGYTKDHFSIFHGRHRLGRTTGEPFADADATKTYFVRWPVPKHVARNLRFCVRAEDEAGNRSGTSCASLTIK
jgi:hypothetical protein